MEDAGLKAITESIEELGRGYDKFKAQRDVLLDALKTIAKCKSNYPGDVVDIANKAIAAVRQEAE